MRFKLLSSVLVVFAFAALSACGGSSKSTPPVVAVSVAPGTAQVPASGTQQYTATVTNTTNTTVTWSVTGGGTISASGLYSAPASVPTQVTATVTATSQADTTKSGTATATLLADSILASPAAANVLPGGTQQFSAAVTNSAQTGVTWTLTGPGTISASGLYTAPATTPSPTTAQVTATLTSDTTQTSNAAVSLLALQSLAISPRGPTLAVGGTETLAATGTFTNGTTLSTSDWTPESTFTSSNAAVATVTGSTVSALTTGVSTITATYAPSGVTAVAGSTAVNVTAGTLSNSSLNGSYVFSLNHAGTRGQAFSAGVFQADGGGHITGGVVDYNAPQGSAKGVSISAGTYTVNADGRGTMTFTAQGSDTYSFILANDGSHGRLLISDSTGVEVGTFELQSATTIGAGTYSLLLGGMDGTVTPPATTTQNPEAVAGHFTVTGTTISGGELDVNDSGVINGGAVCGTPCTPPATALSFTANFAAPIGLGRGTLSIYPTGLPATQLNNTAWDFDYFVVSASKIVLIQTDVQGAAPTFAALTGTAEVQTFASGPALTGDSFVLLLERSAAQGVFGTAGQWQFATTTQLDGEMDVFCLTSCVSPISVTNPPSSYTIDASGRGTATVGTARSFVFYLIGDPASGTARMYVLETDTKANGGVGQQQSTTTTLPSGTLAFNLAQLATGTADSSYLGQYDTGSLTGIVDSNVDVNSVPTPGSAVLTGTVFGSPDTFGRGTLTLSGLPNQTNTNYAYYVVSPTQLVVVGTPATSGATQPVDGTFEIQ